jgi:3-methyl-2-oxobutanoate hydroxymethyltransferase
MRGAARALVVVDMPFGTYEAGPAAAYPAAVRLMQETGCAAVKLEACAGAAATTAFLTERGIPVMGHIGLRPQAALVEGGFRAKGRTEAERTRVLDDAAALDAAGACAIVIEGVAGELATEVTQAVSVPTIGIGASAACDGQILVTDDMLGLFERTPRFVRRYADLRGTISAAVAAYAADVRAGTFPAEAEQYRFGSKG